MAIFHMSHHLSLSEIKLARLIFWGMVVEKGEPIAIRVCDERNHHNYNHLAPFYLTNSELFTHFEGSISGDDVLENLPEILLSVLYMLTKKILELYRNYFQINYHQCSTCLEVDQTDLIFTTKKTSASLHLCEEFEFIELKNYGHSSMSREQLTNLPNAAAQIIR